jgi:hypothetical protein
MSNVKSGAFDILAQRSNQKLEQARHVLASKRRVTDHVLDHTVLYYNRPNIMYVAHALYKMRHTCHDEKSAHSSAVTFSLFALFLKKRRDILVTALLENCYRTSQCQNLRTKC